MRQALDVFGAFDDIICCAALDGFCGHLFGPGAGHDDHRQMRVFGANRFEDLQTFKAEDVEVAQDEIKTTLGERRFKVCARSGLDKFKAAMLFLQRIPHQFTVERVIIYIQDANRLVHVSLSGGATFSDSQ